MSHPFLNFFNNPPVQPPLQYYLQALSMKEWDDVTILTAAWKKSSINPTFTTLQLMASTGNLGPNVRVYTVRGHIIDVIADSIYGQVRLVREKNG